MSNDLTTKNTSPALTNEQRALASLGDEKIGYCALNCMEVSKQTFEEIESIIAASGAMYGNSRVHIQGMWPDRRIIFRSGMSVQAAQQFDSKVIMQLKNEFRGVFSDIAELREKVAKLEAAARLAEIQLREDDSCGHERKVAHTKLVEALS